MLADSRVSNEGFETLANKPSTPENGEPIIKGSFDTCTDNTNSGPYHRWFRKSTPEQHLNWIHAKIHLPAYDVSSRVPDFRNIESYGKKDDEGKG